MHGSGQWPSSSDEVEDELALGEDVESVTDGTFQVSTLAAQLNTQKLEESPRSWKARNSSIPSSGPRTRKPAAYYFQSTRIGDRPSFSPMVGDCITRDRLDAPPTDGRSNASRAHSNPSTPTLPSQDFSFELASKRAASVDDEEPPNRNVQRELVIAERQYRRDQVDARRVGNRLASARNCSRPEAPIEEDTGSSQQSSTCLLDRGHPSKISSARSSANFNATTQRQVSESLLTKKDDLILVTNTDQQSPSQLLVFPPDLSSKAQGEQRIDTKRRDSHQAVAGEECTQSSDDMAAGFQRLSGDARRHPPSNFNRTENRPPMSNILCRNGPQCRKFQEGHTSLPLSSNDADSQLTGTCNYNHDFSGMASNGLNVAKKSLSVESPAFTPAITPKSGNAQPVKMGISPNAIAAATFTPSGSGAVTPARNSHSKEPSGEFVPQFQPTQQFNEFVPGQSFIPQQQMEPPAPMQTPLNAYSDPFLTQSGIANLDGTQPQLNPYAQQTPGVGGQAFFQDANTYKYPLNYHLYASIGPRRENLLAYQRSTADFFIPDNLREDLQRKAEAALQTFANSTLPQSVEYFHSLVALDTNNQKGASTFGYPSWVYKATSSRDGHTYALRRIEGFRLTSEAAIRTVQNWKRFSNGGLVQIHDAFTGRWFNDSSLIIVTDYHPTAQTLADTHFAVGRHPSGSRTSGRVLPENELWSYIVQLASALKAIHEGGQAAQTVTPSKILLTSKNRVRLNGCGVLDIVQYEQRRPVTELQRGDLEDLGRVILGLATRNQTAFHNMQKGLDQVSRSYTERLRACIAWLLTPLSPPQDSPQSDTQQVSDYNINTLLNNIADKVISAFDSTLHLEDELTSNLMRELENGRFVRLLTKLNVILERPENSNAPGSSQPSNPNMLNQPSTAWSETGERYYLKLFRDYVFHQVEHDGRPVLDLGHVLTCLSKLDAGVDEKLQLVSRDEQNVFVVTYREVKRGFEAAWADLSKAGSATRR